jgi:hypothetical protein
VSWENLSADFLSVASIAAAGYLSGGYDSNLASWTNISHANKVASDSYSNGSMHSSINNVNQGYGPGSVRSSDHRSVKLAAGVNYLNSNSTTLSSSQGGGMKGMTISGSGAINVSNDPIDARSFIGQPNTSRNGIKAEKELPQVYGQYHNYPSSMNPVVVASSKPYTAMGYGSYDLGNYDGNDVSKINCRCNLC